MNTANQPKSNETLHYQRNPSSNDQNQNPKSPRLLKLKLQNQLHCNVAHRGKLIVENIANPGRAVILNDQGTEGITATLQRSIVGLGEIWGLEKKQSEREAFFSKPHIAIAT